MVRGGNSRKQLEMSREKWVQILADQGLELCTTIDDYTSGGYITTRCYAFSHEFTRRIDSHRGRMKKGLILCPFCADLVPSVKKPFEISEKQLSIKIQRRLKMYNKFCEELMKKDWQMVSPPSDYEDTTSPMKVICPKKHDTTKTYQSFVVDQRDCRFCVNVCVACFTPEYVREYISKRGATWTGPDEEYRVVLDRLSITCKCSSPTRQTFLNFQQTQGNCWNCNLPKLRERLSNMSSEAKTQCSKRKTFLLGDQNIRIQGYEHKALRDLLSGKHGDKLEVSEIKAGEGNVPSIPHVWKGKECSYTPDIFIPTQGVRGKYIEVKSSHWFNFDLERNLSMYESLVAQGYEFEIWFYEHKNARIKKITLLLEEDGFVYVTEEDEPTKARNHPAPLP